jgi:hypothetical protein
MTPYKLSLSTLPPLLIMLLLPAAHAQCLPGTPGPACTALVDCSQGTCEPLNGSLSFDFGAGNRIYTLGQGAKQLARGLRVAGISVKCSGLNVAVSGKLRGHCSMGGTVNGVKINADGPLNLSLSSEGEGTRLKERLQLSGEASAFGQTVKFTATGSGTALIFDGDTSVDLSVSVRVCVEGQCVRDGAFVALDLSPQDGLWTLQINITTKGSGKLRGSGIANLYRRRLKYKVKGRYDPATGLSQVRLKARKNRRHNKISLSNVRTSGGVLAGDMDFKLFGQERRDVPIIAAGPTPRAAVRRDDQSTHQRPERLDDDSDPVGMITLHVLESIVGAVGRSHDEAP